MEDLKGCSRIDCATLPVLSLAETIGQDLMVDDGAKHQAVSASLYVAVHAFVKYLIFPCPIVILFRRELAEVIIGPLPCNVGHRSCRIGSRDPPHPDVGCSTI
jgi:hypothetical protein